VWILEEGDETNEWMGVREVEGEIYVDVRG
jgi:hypothetical protein